MNKIILGLALATALSTSSYAAVTQLPAAQPAASSSKSGTEFESLSKAEKIKLIEQKHVQSKAKADAKWKTMSDDEKIAKYEHRRQAFMARRNGTALPDGGRGPINPPTTTQTTPITPNTTTANPVAPVKK